MLSHSPWGMAGPSASSEEEWVPANSSQKAGGYSAVKYYHSAQVWSLYWCSRLHKSPVTKVLFSFEYTEQQELGYCICKFLLEAAWALLRFRLLAHSVCPGNGMYFAVQSGCCCWAVQTAWSQSDNTAADRGEIWNLPSTTQRDRSHPCGSAAVFGAYSKVLSSLYVHQLGHPKLTITIHFMWLASKEDKAEPHTLKTNSQSANVGIRKLSESGCHSYQSEWS